MKLKELKQGMNCRLRDGEFITVTNSGLFFTSGYMVFDLEVKYNEDLTHKENRHLDIMEVTYGDKVVFKRNESNRWFVPEYDEKYFYTNEFGGIISLYFLNSPDQYHDKILNNNRVFKTKEEAEKRVRQEQATLSVERWIAENDVEVDVNDSDVLKCSVLYDVKAEEFEVEFYHYFIIMPKQFILSSEEKAKQLIKEREKELKIMFGVEE